MFGSIKKINLIPVDFTKPWWHLISIYRWTVVSIVVNVTITQVIWSLTPFLAAKLFESRSYMLCCALFSAWLITDFILSTLRKNSNTQFQLSCIHSIYQSAHKLLLTIDPKYHVHRSTGAVLAKIERAARGYEDFADKVTFDILPLFMGLITVVIALSYYSYTIALVMTGFILLLLGVNYYVATTHCQRWEDAHIEKDDAFKTIAMENSTQIQLIRSTFATPYRYKNLVDSIYQNSMTERALWISYINLFMGLGLVYLSSLWALALLLLYQINAGVLSSATALGLFLVYVQSSKEIIKFNRMLRKLNHSKAAIKNLFDYIPFIGKQTFPVLGDITIAVPPSQTTTLNAHQISFDYGKAHLFNDHSLTLSVPDRQPLKLYGIIGASGAGKTTLLSILGGQLKPIRGTIVINDIDIYQVTDAMRSRLVALQSQVSSNVRGTVKNNLLLGLPEQHGFTDDQLRDILDNVGLLPILNNHNGLETMLGEGGLNLSGGQRQRLNFAALYLRGLYYKPLLILIDEPTSSLDEISERAITRMIEKLAHDSVTLVVAHRLKTIQKAVGIIDLSLLAAEKTIKMYTQQELLSRSRYYQELINGTVDLDTDDTREPAQ